LTSAISRRNLLRAGLPALAPTTPCASGDAAISKNVKIGFVTNGFRDYSNAALAKEFQAAGIRRIQLFLTQTDSNYWKYNNRSDLTSLTPRRCQEIAGIYRSAGISIHSLGVYANLIHPDAAERNQQLAYFEAMMKVGQAMGVRRLVTEAGHYFEANRPAQQVPYDWQEGVWHSMVSTCKELARRAEANDSIVLFEPFFLGLLSTARRTKLLLEEANSPQLRINLDPANLIEVNDLEEMFGQLQSRIESFHAKDRKLHIARGVPAGEGDVDYVSLLRLAAARVPDAPLFLEYADSKTRRAALAYVRNAIHQAGLREV